MRLSQQTFTDSAFFLLAPHVANCKRPSFWLTTNVVIILSTIVIRQFNPTIGYANDGACDSWYFFGIYRDYFHLKSYLVSAYQFFRFPALLPWIYLGPHMSMTALHELRFWTYFLIASGCFSYSAITLLGSRVGFLISVLFLCGTLFLGALSTDYVTGAGLAWECATIAATTFASRSNRLRLWSFVTGTLFACCFYTHSPMALFVFSVPLFFLARQPLPTIAEFVPFTIFLFAGFVATTFAICLYNVLIGGDFLFYENEIAMAFRYMGHNIYQRPMSGLQWFAYDTNIPVFLLAGGASLIVIIKLMTRRPHNHSIFLLPAVIYLPVAVLCFGLEFANRMVLQENVYAPWMLPIAFLAIGSALALCETLDKLTLPFIGVAVVPVLCLAAIRLDPGIAAPWRYALAIVAIAILAPRLRGWTSIIAPFCVVSLVLFTYPVGYGAAAWAQVVYNGRELYELAAKAHQFVAKNDGGKRPLFWISGDPIDMADPLFLAIVTPRTFLECSDAAGSFPDAISRKSGLNTWLPSLTDLVKRGYAAAGERLFIIARGHDLIAAGAKGLRQTGIHVRALSEMEISSGVSIAAGDIQTVEPRTARFK